MSTLTAGRVRTTVVALATIAASIALLGTPSVAARSTYDAQRAVASPSISAPKTVIEGTRFAVTTRIPSAARARTVTLQFHNKGQYDYQSITVWTKTAAAAVNGRSKITFHVRADASRETWFRVVVSYRHAASTHSTAARVNYQHWYPLKSFSSYYHAGSAVDYVGFQMAGQSWNGWYVLSTTGESRYTLGSGCNRIRATIGVLDSSSDGATATVTLATIAPGGAATTIYTSPNLAAGQTTTIDRALAYPYRFSISGQDTTPAAPQGTTQPVAHAAVGDPEFLCHFS